MTTTQDGETPGPELKAAMAYADKERRQRNDSFLLDYGKGDWRCDIIQAYLAGAQAVRKWISVNNEEVIIDGKSYRLVK